jgi:SpoIID/LytB domain protein
MRKRSRFLLLSLVGLLLAGTVSFVSSSVPAQAADWYPVPSSRTYTVDGHGYGHGRGLSQWGAQGAATKGLSAQQILDFYYPGTTRTQIGTPRVRVQVSGTTTGDLRIDSNAGTTVMAIQDTATGTTAYASPGQFRVLTSGTSQRILRYNGSAWVNLSIGGSGVYAGPLAFWSEDGVTVWTGASTARNYRGSVNVVRTGSGVSTAVNNVNMQEYLMGVVPKESPPSFLPAALQAQAVAARSYAWWDVQTPSAGHYDICDTTACQVYGGRSLWSGGRWTVQEAASTNNAVAATAGSALYYMGAPAFAQFSASNGGASLAGSQPYLRAALDPYDGVPAGNPNHNWSSPLSASYLESTYPQIGTLQGLRITSRSGLGEWGGYITSLEVVGTNATVTVSSPRFGLKSTWWKPRDQGNPYGGYDALLPVTGNHVRVTGWAVDPNSSSSIPVHAYVDGRGQGAFAAAVPRPDVAAALGRGERHGYDITLPVSQGKHEVCIYAINVGPGDLNPLLGCRTVDTKGLPVGNIEAATIDGADAVLTGWAVDPDSAASLTVHAYVNGVGKGAFAASGHRPDVAVLYPDLGAAHGLSVRVPLRAGANEVCLYAINVPEPALNPELGCRTLELKVQPFGNLEAVTGGAADFSVKGWAIDPETSAPIDVHVYVDDVGVGAVTADRSRSDIAAAYPASGERHGFSATLPTAPGSHEVCVFAMNVLQGTANPRLGCRTVDVGLRPLGRIEGTSVDDFEVRVRGWALDPDTSAPIDVQLHVDGRVAQVVTAADARPDVAAVYPAAGSAHGFDVRLSFAAGRHTVCAYGVNVLGARGNPLLACVPVVVAQGRSLPFGMLDSAHTANRITTVSGWVVEPEAPTAPVTVSFTVDGRRSAKLVAREPRPDVAAAHAGVGPEHGFVGHFILKAGRHTVCAYAIDQKSGSGEKVLGCRVVTVP